MEDEGRNILGGRRHPAEHRQAADADPLLDGRVPREDAVVVEAGVPRDERIVHHGAAVADPYVVAHMRAAHEQVAIADDRHAVPLDRTAMDRHELAEDVAVADFQSRRLVAIAAMLRALAQHGAVGDEVVAAHPKRAAEAGMGLDDASGADLNRPLDDRIRPDLHVWREDRVGIDDGRCVNQFRISYCHRPILLAGAPSPSDIRYALNREFPACALSQLHRTRRLSRSDEPCITG